jgi:hypothetical protein
VRDAINLGWQALLSACLLSDLSSEFSFPPIQCEREQNMFNSHHLAALLLASFLPQDANVAPRSWRMSKRARRGLGNDLYCTARQAQDTNTWIALLFAVHHDIFTLFRCCGHRIEPAGEDKCRSRSRGKDVQVQQPSGLVPARSRRAHVAG